MANRQPMAQPNVAGQNMNAQNVAAGGRDLDAMAQMMTQGGRGNINGQVQNQPFENQQAGLRDDRMRQFGRRGR